MAAVDAQPFGGEPIPLAVRNALDQPRLRPHRDARAGARRRRRRLPGQAVLGDRVDGAGAGRAAAAGGTGRVRARRAGHRLPRPPRHARWPQAGPHRYRARPAARSPATLAACAPTTTWRASSGAAATSTRSCCAPSSGACAASSATTPPSPSTSSPSAASATAWRRRRTGEARRPANQARRAASRRVGLNGQGHAAGGDLRTAWSRRKVHELPDGILRQRIVRSLHDNARVARCRSCRPGEKP